MLFQEREQAIHGGRFTTSWAYKQAEAAARERNPRIVIGSAATVLKTDDLLKPFHDAEKPPSRWRVGTEAEKFGVFTDDTSPLFYDGDRGVQRLFETLVGEFGWNSTRETPDGPIISLKRDGASITLEPGAQVELSGAPFSTIHETRSEFDSHLRELHAVGDPHGLSWLGLGMHPLATLDELPHVPKLRYEIMRSYMPTRGPLSLDMMYRTATVQANLDYENEEDAIRKLAVSLRLQPIVTAMFANSPWLEGRRSGKKTYRANVWLNMDVDRSGLLPFAFDRPCRYQDYVEWALNVPMFMIKHEETVLQNTGQTFRSFMKDGYQGATATYDDWTTHLNTLFPEVRLKNIIEVRGADSQNMDLLCALPALWKGLLYDSKALDAAQALTESLDFNSLQQARLQISELALDARLNGKKVADWAAQTLQIATDGLQRIGNFDETGHDERQYLAPLVSLVDQGLCPADVLLKALPEERPDPHALVKLTSI